MAQGRWRCLAVYLAGCAHRQTKGMNSSAGRCCSGTCILRRTHYAVIAPRVYSLSCNSAPCILILLCELPGALLQVLVAARGPGNRTNALPRPWARRHKLSYDACGSPRALQLTQFRLLGSVQFRSVQFRSVQLFSSVQFTSVQFSWVFGLYWVLSSFFDHIFKVQFSSVQFSSALFLRALYSKFSSVLWYHLWHRYYLLSSIIIL